MSAPLWLRRLRALVRRPRRIDGFVDGCVAGEIRGWALEPGAPGRRVHVVALCEGQVVAEALADLSRMDLIQEGRGDGRHGFRLKLPPGLLDGAVRTVRVEAVAGGARERLLRSDIEIRPPEPPAHQPSPEPGSPGAAPGRAAVAGQGRAALVIWSEGEEAAARTEASWARQDWPDRDVIRLAAGEPDETRLRERLQSAHTVLFARAGDELDPAAARLLVQARPLADVVTWRGRPEARALGVLLGETLGGALAARGHVLGAYDGRWTDALRSPGLRRLELWLASRTELRWAHLGAPITVREGGGGPAGPLRREDAEGLDGLVWREGEGGRTARLVPARFAERITLAVWPAADAAAQTSLLSLLEQAPPGVEIELLSSAEGLAPLRALVAAAAAQVTIRAVDAPQSGGAGLWLRALGDAASGEVVLLARSGVRWEPKPHGLEELAAWCLSPRVGAATVALHGEGATPLSGLGLSRTGEGWRVGSAHDPACEGQARPVLATPAAFTALSRARLTAVGGADDLRFPGAAADLDLGLRLRRAGWCSVLLGDLSASWSGGAVLAEGSDLAPFDPAELAAAAAAFPAGEPA